ncbi:phosphopantetheine-binding protein [Amycolatopsis sp. La24]|uniref:acyl carrier protein n=1 Tax=Amycolatopsis sp. La24 TaxID=3028304 RepID=UPI0023B1545C|nr:phosphopantetheine-binding protein [Amycolatopsis sp. La24]
MDDRVVTREEVEEYIVGLLAEEFERDAEELMSELAALSPEMPCDSVLLVELMTRVSARFGVRFEATFETARDMRSVRGFADRVCEELAATALTTQSEGVPADE